MSPKIYHRLMLLSFVLYFTLCVVFLLCDEPAIQCVCFRWLGVMLLMATLCVKMFMFYMGSDRGLVGVGIVYAMSVAVFTEPYTPILTFTIVLLGHWLWQFGGFLGMVGVFLIEYPGIFIWMVVIAIFLIIDYFYPKE